jgi:excinuclease UvrABC nuclease subunit
MLAAAKKLEFERAALLRDQINELKSGFGEGRQPKLKKREVAYTVPDHGRPPRRKR